MAEYKIVLKCKNASDSCDNLWYKAISTKVVPQNCKTRRTRQCWLVLWVVRVWVSRRFSNKEGHEEESINTRVCAVFSFHHAETHYRVRSSSIVRQPYSKELYNPRDENKYPKLHYVRETSLTRNVSTLEQNIFWIIFYVARERAKFKKSCILGLVPGAGGIFSCIPTATAGGIHRVDLFSWTN